MERWKISQPHIFMVCEKKLDTDTWEDKENVADISSEMEPTRQSVL